MKNSFSLIRQGCGLFTSLIPRRPFLWSYLLCYALYDIASALYATARPDDMAGQVQLELSIGGNLSLFMSVLVLLILNGSQPVFAGRTWKLLARTWVANLVAGLYIVLGFICLIIPGVILTLRYLYVNEAVALENLTINAALARSKRLSSINGGRTFWAATIIFAVYITTWLLACGTVSIVAGDAALNSFAFNYLGEIIGSAITILMAVCVYAGYLDACANEAGTSAASSPDAGNKGEPAPSAAAVHPSHGSAEDRSLGRTYAQALARLSATSLQQRQALLRDLLGENRSLWPPLRHLIEQPGFLIMLQESSPASRSAARDALLQELELQYLPQVMERVRAFVAGLLEC